jgi:hypothetical protein
MGVVKVEPLGCLPRAATSLSRVVQRRRIPTMTSSAIGVMPQVAAVWRLRVLTYGTNDGKRLRGREARSVAQLVFCFLDKARA